MINAKQTFLSLSLVLMAATVPVSAMQQQPMNQEQWLIKMGVSTKNVPEDWLKEKHGEWLKAQTRYKDVQGISDKQEKKRATQKAQDNIVKINKEAKDAIIKGQFIVHNVQPEDSIEVSDAQHSGALVLYRDSFEIIKPIMFDVSLACKLAEEMQASPSEPVSLFSRIVRDNTLSLAPNQNLSPRVFNPENIRVEEIAQEIEIDVNTLRDADGNIIAQVTDGDDIDNTVGIEIPGYNPPVIEVPVDADIAGTHSLKALSKPLIFGLLGVCGVSALGWKLYQKTSHYQCGLLKKWQMQVADAIVGITSGTKGSYAQISPIELSQLTRLTDVEREQLAQAHNSLVMAFDKVQQTVAHAATDEVSRNGQVAIDQIPVVKELKVAHAQWDNLMNNCKNVVEQGSMRLW